MNKKCGNCKHNTPKGGGEPCDSCDYDYGHWEPVNKYKRKIEALEQRMIKHQERIVYRESKRLEKISKKKLKREQKEMLSHIVDIQKRGYDNTLDIKIIKDGLSECRLNVSRLNNQVHEQAEIISELRLLVDINKEAKKIDDKSISKLCIDCKHSNKRNDYACCPFSTNGLCITGSEWERPDIEIKEPVGRPDVKIISDVECDCADCENSRIYHDHIECLVDCVGQDKWVKKILHECTDCKYSKLKNNNDKCPYAVDGSCFCQNKWEKAVEEPTVEKKCSNCKFSGENTNSFCCTKHGCDDTHSKWEFISDGEKIENSPKCKSCRYSNHNNGEGLSCVDYRIKYCVYTTCNNFSEWKAVEPPKTCSKCKNELITENNKKYGLCGRCMKCSECRFHSSDSSKTCLKYRNELGLTKACTFKDCQWEPKDYKSTV